MASCQLNARSRPPDNGPSRGTTAAPHIRAPATRVCPPRPNRGVTMGSPAITSASRPVRSPVSTLTRPARSYDSPSASRISTMPSPARYGRRPLVAAKLLPYMPSPGICPLDNCLNPNGVPVIVGIGRVSRVPAGSLPRLRLWPSFLSKPMIACSFLVRREPQKAFFPDFSRPAGKLRESDYPVSRPSRRRHGAAPHPVWRPCVSHPRRP